MIRSLILLAATLLPALAHGQPLYPEHPDLRRHLADPFVLAADDGFYLYATGDGAAGRKIAVWFSEDLTAWEERPGAVARGAEGAWNRDNFWAPEVYAVGGEFHLYYTAKPDGGQGNAGNRVGLAVADHPGGPFENRGVVVHHPSLDGTVFTDAAGDRWLFWTTEWEDASGFGSGRILVDRLVSPPNSPATRGSPSATTAGRRPRT